MVKSIREVAEGYLNHFREVRRTRSYDTPNWWAFELMIDVAPRAAWRGRLRIPAHRRRRGGSRVNLTLADLAGERRRSSASALILHARHERHLLLTLLPVSGGPPAVGRFYPRPAPRSAGKLT